MKQSLVIRMPEPCTESWSDMEPTANGRSCARCSKELIDFSTYSNAQLADYAANHSGKLCGHFAPHQLNRNLVAAPVAASLTGLSLPALALMAATLTAQPAYSQETIRSVTQSAAAQPDSLDKQTLPLVIAGTVTDANNSEPLYGCRVQLLLKDSVLQTTTTDFDGHFAMTGSPDRKFDQLRVSNPQEMYEEQTIPLSPRGSTTSLVIRMGYPNEYALDGEVTIQKKSIHHYKRLQRRADRKNN